MPFKVLQTISIPKQSNQVFVSPQWSSWPACLIENIEKTSGLESIQEAKLKLLQLANDYTLLLTGDCPKRFDKFIVSGHQPNWHHCGILAKIIAAAGLAAQEQIAGYLHIVLDHDITSTGLKMPVPDNNGYLTFRRLGPNEINSNKPLEYRSLLPAGALEQFIANACNLSAPDSLWNTSIDLPTITQKYNHLTSMADMITLFHSLLHRKLGLSPLYLKVSTIAGTHSFLKYFLRIIFDAPRFSYIYNTAISDNQAQSKPNAYVRTLFCNSKDNIFELPFWLISPQGVRNTLVVQVLKYSINLISDSTGRLTLNSHSFDKALIDLTSFLDETQYRIRPKAVTLMLFIRIYLADLFIHGVGGSRYETITDAILRNYYEIDPPAYTIATCTMRLPIQQNISENCEDLSTLKYKLHRILHNPEFFIHHDLKTPEVNSLIETKHKLICKATDRNAPRPSRYLGWKLLQKINNNLSSLAHSEIERLQNQIALLKRQDRISTVSEYREFFFGLFSKESLQNLM